MGLPHSSGAAVPCPSSRSTVTAPADSGVALDSDGSTVKAMGSGYPSMKPRALLKVLRGLGYHEEQHNGGSHRWVTNGTKRFRWAFHDRQTISPGLVKKILTRDVGLSDDEAKRLF